MAVSKARCRDLTEPASYKRTDLGPSGSWSAKFEISGQETGCLNYMFEKDDILKPGCLAGKHLFFIGGSIGTGMPMNLMHMLRPFDYPADPEEWLGCKGECNISKDAWPTAVSFVDLVVDSNGNVLNMQGSATIDPVDSPDMTLKSSVMQNIIDRMNAAPDAGPGGVRITWVRSRTLKSGPGIFISLQQATSQKPGSTQLQPMLFVGVQAWWYDFCRYGSSDSYLCEMDRSYSLSELEGKVEDEANDLVTNVIAQVPSVHRPIYILNARDHTWYGSAVQAGIGSTSNAKIMDEEDSDYSYIGFSIWDYIYQNHPENSIHMLRTQRYLNAVCSSAPAQVRVASIQFDGKGCTANDRSWTDSWDRHLYQTCTFSVTNDAVPTAPDTPSPTLSPVEPVKPTALPTASPTATGCLPVGDSCQSHSDCCTVYCDSAVSQCALATSGPTASPTARATEPVPVPEPVPEPSGTLNFTVKLPEEWWDNSTGLLGSGAMRSHSEAMESTGQLITYTSAGSLVDAATFHYVASVLSALVLLVGFLVFILPSPLQKKLSDTLCCCFGSSPSSRPSYPVKKPLKKDSEDNTSMISIPKDGGESPSLLLPSRIEGSAESGESDASRERRNLRRMSSMLSTTPVATTLSEPDAVETIEEERIKIQDLHEPVKKGAYFSAVSMPTNKLEGLGFARYLASVHVVVGHVTNENAKGYQLIEGWFTNSFGFTWVPWFMMLSGFVLTYAQLNRHDKYPDQPSKPWYIFTWDRVRGIYPLYFLGLVVDAAIRSHYRSVGFFEAFGSAEELFTSVFLIQAWNPMVTERVLQAHCWFLSCIVPYWVAHNFVSKQLGKLSFNKLAILATVLCAAPVVLLYVIPLALGTSVSWYEAHEYGALPSTTVDFLVVVLKYHPITYFGIYLLGMVSARLYFVVRDDPPVVFRYGALLGYSGLLLVFLLEGGLQFWPGSLLAFRLGALGPFQALILIGLAVGTDPVAKLFSLPVLQCLENLSYPQYIFQFIVLQIWGIYTGFGFWLLLNAVALVTYFFVQKPLRNKRSTRGALFFGLFSLIVIALVLFGAFVLRVDEVDRSAHFGPRAPDVIRYTDSVSDVRLDFNSDIDTTFPLHDGPSFNINPSVYWDTSAGVMRVAYRRHRYELHRTRLGDFTHAGEAVGNVVRERHLWFSDVMVGALDATWHVDRVRRVSLGLRSRYSVKHALPAWHARTCDEPPLYIPENRTVVEVGRLGPEDPRIVRGTTKGEDGFLLTYNSLPLARSANGTCLEAKRMFQADVATMVFGNADGDDSDTYASDLPDELKLRFGKPDLAEKNWMTFWDRDSRTAMFVQLVQPLVVVTAGQREGEAAVMVEVSRSSSAVLKQTLKGKPGVKIHGGANPILVEDSTGQLLHLGTFHTVDQQRRYLNFAFTFTAHAPYEVVHVSDPLPLVMAPIQDGSLEQRMTMCTGLAAMPDGTLVFSYGSSNSESRVLTMKMDNLVSLLKGQDGVALDGEQKWKVVDNDM